MKETDEVNFANPIFFFNRKGMNDVVYKVSTILFLDDDTCLVVAKPLQPIFKDDDFIDLDKNVDLKILFNPQNKDILSYHAENLALTQDLFEAASRVSNKSYYVRT